MAKVKLKTLGAPARKFMPRYIAVLQTIGVSPLIAIQMALAGASL